MISFHFRFGSGSVPSSLSYTWSLLSLPYTTTLPSISILRFHYGPTIYALLGVLPLCPVASPFALWPALVPCGRPLCPVDSPCALWMALVPCGQPLCPVASPCALWTALVPCGQPFTPIHPPTALHPHPTAHHPAFQFLRLLAYFNFFPHFSATLPPIESLFTHTSHLPTPLSLHSSTFFTTPFYLLLERG
jgi:hypothetical protein